MGSSKRKSSFRIDDILHQQVESQFYSQNQHAIPNQSLLDAAHIPSTLNGTKHSLNSHSSPSPPPLQQTPAVSSSSSPIVNSSDIPPRKPMPMYHPQLMDLQKANFPLPLPFLGQHHFNPAAAYLEHYANVLHKGKFYS